MPYRSMEKTNADKIKDIEDKNPENRQVQSVESNAYNESAVIAEEKQEKVHKEKWKDYINIKYGKLLKFFSTTLPFNSFLLF